MGLDDRLADFPLPTTSPAMCAVNFCGLASRHMQMIAIGGAIGTGLFLASGATVANAGPGGALRVRGDWPDGAASCSPWAR